MRYLARDKVCKRTKATCHPPRMILGSPRHFFILLLSAVMLLGGCATKEDAPVAITKVNPYHFTPGRQPRTEDPMTRFEQSRMAHGQITNAERRERLGNYYSVFWKTKTKSPATVRLEYRQGNTGPKIYSKETFVADPGRTNVTKFEVVGDEYHSLGKVTQWKVSIVEDGVVVSEYKSFLWN